MQAAGNNISIQEIPGSPEQRLFSSRFFHTERITTVVTFSHIVVNEWIFDTWNDPAFHDNGKLVGFSVKWNLFYRYSYAGILQLCVGNRCLIVQLTKMNEIPDNLVRFFNDPTCTFVGLGNDWDAHLLHRTKPFLQICSEVVDLRFIAAEMLWDWRLQYSISMEYLMAEVFSVGIEIDYKILWSDWHVDELTLDQVLFASNEVHISFLLGYHYQVWSRTLFPWVRRPRLPQYS